MRRMICGVIRAYQIGISPWVPAACRFTPTCSRYALEAVGRFGVLWGGWLGTRPVLRCHAPERVVSGQSGNLRGYRYI